MVTNTARSATPRSGYVPELDGIRGIAIAGVMALHFVGTITATNVLERAVGKASSYGVWGVDLFFVLSGFLITGILLDAKGSPRYFRNFYMRRVLRIFPLYYAVVAALFVLIPVAAARSFDPQLVEMRQFRYWIWPYLTNVYLGGQQDFSIPYVSHFWSLAVEEHFYLAWPFLILLLSRRAAMRLSIALAVVALALRLWFTFETPTLLYANVLTPCRLDSLCIGGWFAMRARDDAPLAVERAVRWTIAVGASILALSSWHVFQTSTDPVLLPLRTTLLSIFFGLAIYAAAMPTGPALLRAGLRVGWLRLLGKYSYGLYVYHGLIAYALHRHSPEVYLTAVTRSHVVAAALQIGFGVGLSLVVSIASYEFFEVRFLALKRLFDYVGAHKAPAVAAEPLVAPLVERSPEPASQTAG